MPMIDTFWLPVLEIVLEKSTIILDIIAITIIIIIFSIFI